VAEGLAEVVSLPFTAPDGDASVALLNPLADTGATLRRRLLPTLSRHVEKNWNNQVRDVRLFEIGTVFERSGPGQRPREQLRAALVVTGAREPAHWTAATSEDVDLWDLKRLTIVAGALAYPSATWHVEGDHLMARVKDGPPVGWAGRLDADSPPWGAALFGVEIDIALEARAHATVVPLPGTPAVERDLSLVMPDGVTAAAVEAVIRTSAGELLESVRIIAEYRGAALGEGRRSVTFRLTFRAPDRTLRDADVDAVEGQVLMALETGLKLARRGG
jgi:phenylalanyl-tRNA synthetase beta chain